MCNKLFISHLIDTLSDAREKMKLNGKDEQVTKMSELVKALLDQESMQLHERMIYEVSRDMYLDAEINDAGIPSLNSILTENSIMHMTDRDTKIIYL